MTRAVIPVAAVAGSAAIAAAAGVLGEFLLIFAAGTALAAALAAAVILLYRRFRPPVRRAVARYGAVPAIVTVRQPAVRAIPANTEEAP